MNSTLENKLLEALRGLLAKSQDIDSAAVVSLDGFVIAYVLPPGYEDDRLGAMSAALLSLG